jgi:hypothetical protein
VIVRPTNRAGALAAVEAEVAEEKAASLGRAGVRVERALAVLAASGCGPDRDALLKAARDAVWGLFVQREVMGQRDHAAVVAHYGIPADVLRGLGSR